MGYFFTSFLKILGYLFGIVFFIIFLAIFGYLLGNKKEEYFLYSDGKIDSDKQIAILKLNGPIISEPNPLNNFDFLQNIEVIYPALIKII